MSDTDPEEALNARLQREIQEMEHPELDYGGGTPQKKKRKKIVYDMEPDEDELCDGGAPKKRTRKRNDDSTGSQSPVRKKKAVDADVRDTLLAMTGAIGNLTTMMNDIQRNKKKEPDALTIDDLVAHKVAVNQFKNPGIERQCSILLKIKLKLNEAMKQDDPDKLVKMVKDVIKDVDDRYALLELADKNPRAFAIADAHEATKKLDDISKNLSKDVRDSILNDRTGRTHRYRGIEESFGQPFNGSYYGYYNSNAYSGNQQRIPSLMEGVRQPGPCFICKGPHLKKDCTARRNTTRRAPY